MPPRRPSTNQPDKRAVRVPRLLLYGAAGVSLVGVGALTLLGIWFVHRIERLERIRMAATERYAALDAEFEFRREEGTPVAASRVESYRKARAALAGGASPEIDRLASVLLAESGWKEPRLIRALSGEAAARFLETALEAHAGALRAESMSPTEYLWLHGMAVREELAGGAGETVRQDYERVLRSLGKLAASNEDVPYAFTIEAYERGLAAIYGDVEMPAAEPPPGDGTAARAVDLVSAAFALDGGPES